MKYLSVCSGIEAASVAWHDLGWEPVAFSEIEPFPSAVLRHHYPGVPNLGDFTQIGANDVGSIDLVVGGTPCQDFSVAGLRAGLAGERGHLTIEFVRLLERLKPRWFVWENVPGVLSADKGRAFGVFLGALDELGYSCAWRVLDAQYFGVPQRRRRVFVVGNLGNWRASAEVLFECESVFGRPTPRGETKQTAVRGIEIGPSGGGRTEVAPTLDARCRDGFIRNQLGAGAIVANTVAARTGPGRNGADLDTYVPVQHNFPVREINDGVTGTLFGSGAGTQRTSGTHDESSYLVITASSAVRRLTPRECERLQGFPDDWTLVPHRNKDAADGPRYRALGNSMAVPVMRLIGERIALIELLGEHDTAA